jgi:hypothetical protein
MSKHDAICKPLSAIARAAAHETGVPPAWYYGKRMNRSEENGRRGAWCVRFDYQGIAR